MFSKLLSESDINFIAYFSVIASYRKIFGFSKFGNRMKKTRLAVLEISTK